MKLKVNVILNSEDSGSGGVAIIGEEDSGYTETEGGEEGGMEENFTAGMGEPIKDPLLSSWPAVIGISSGTLIAGILIGVLFAVRKIKKGIDVYED